MDHVQIYHGNRLSWAVRPAVARRVSDWVNHHVRKGREINKSVWACGRWVGLRWGTGHDEHKDEGRIGSIKLCIEGDVAKDKEKGVPVNEKMREKYGWCSGFLTQTPYMWPNKLLVLIPLHVCCSQFLNIGPPNNHKLTYSAPSVYNSWSDHQLSWPQWARLPKIASHHG